MRATRVSRVFIAALAASATAVIATAVPASAHMSINTYGTTFTAGKTNVIYFRVPHGCPDADAANHGGFNLRTTAVEVNITDVTKVASVKPEQKPGWRVEVERNVDNAVTKVTWTANNAVADALHDWTFADFGIRATLNGAAGDVIAFPAKQYCGLDNANNVVSPPETEVWENADAPKLTLVSVINAVQSAADLADLKARVVSLEASVTGALASIANLVAADTSIADRVAAVESAITGINATVLGSVTASKNSGRLAVSINLPTLYRYHTVALKVNGAFVRNVWLNLIGNGNVQLSKFVSAGFSVGQNVQVYAGQALVASGTIT